MMVMATKAMAVVVKFPANRATEPRADLRAISAWDNWLMFLRIGASVPPKAN